MQSRKVRALAMALSIAVLSYAVFNTAPVLAEETLDSECFVDAVGTYFEIANSNYLDITLTSSETVHVFLESASEMISLFIESNSSATSSTLTFGGFEINAAYYRYQEGYLIEEFITDSNGAYTYTQDLSELHHVYIQEHISTLYISSNYTFTSNIYYNPIVVAADNIIIDGNGYTLQGPGGGYGFYLYGRSNVTIKNVTIKSWQMGIWLILSNYNTISGNTITWTNDGVRTASSLHNTVVGNDIAVSERGIVFNSGSDHNTIAGNDVTAIYGYGIWATYSSCYNTISGNNIAANPVDICFYSTCRYNIVYHNNFIDNVSVQDYELGYNNWYSPELLEGNYWSDYLGVDDGSGTGKHAIAGDGIGDTSIPWPGDNYDHYPFISESGWLDTTPPEITIVTPEPYGLYAVNMALDFYATDASGVASIVGHLANTAGGCQEVESDFTPQPGVYTLVVVATDNRGNTGESDPVFFVVYDPDGGFATGGGWIYPDAESTLPEGKAHFGFVAKYKQSSSMGNLEFQYQDADINLKSTTIDWLVISSNGAQFQGTGTINGENLFTFRILVKDNCEPGVGSDEFNIWIWAGTDTETDPIHKAKNIIAGGNIVIHKK